MALRSSALLNASATTATFCLSVGAADYTIKGTKDLISMSYAKLAEARFARCAALAPAALGSACSHYCFD